MAMKTSKVLILLIVTGSPFAAKNRDWKTGTVTEAAYVRENLGGGAVAIAQSSGNSSNPVPDPGVFVAAAAAARPTYQMWQRLTVEADGYVFKVSCLVRWHKPNVTTRGPLKYALEKGGKFYIQDEDGREFKMFVLEKALMQAPTKETGAR
jgi:hypothetical protein